MARTGKFYRKNEAEIMQELGLQPTPNSGSGWVVKEDGQSENIICQLKSTDSKSIKVNLQDIHTLQYNAAVAHKVPVFAINFLATNEVFLLIAPEDAQEALQSLFNVGQGNMPVIDKSLPNDQLEASTDVPVIRSSDKAREMLRQELQNQHKKKGKSAK